MAAYRRMYRAHWSFPPLQRMMRTIPRLTVWDDHEIRDGWGSEDQDFAGGNPVVFDAAREVAEEFILNNGPRIRPSDDGAGGTPDAHQAYISGSVACFIFDGRTSRRYSNPDGRIISEEQLADFEASACRIARDRRVRFLRDGHRRAVHQPQGRSSRSSGARRQGADHLSWRIRDDIRDSWHSKGNRGELSG